MDRDEVEVHKHAKKERGQYPAILGEQAWSIKDLLYGIKHQNMINYPCGTCPYPEQMPARVANHSPKMLEMVSYSGKFSIVGLQESVSLQYLGQVT